jgi:Zn-dependent peptidase ImmA (M78 family)
MNITLQPRVLRWVRERAGLSKEDLADGLGLGLDKVEDWERRGALTFGQAERIAKRTHAPLGYLFLREPLRESLPIPDLRTVAGQRASEPSLELLDTLDEAERRQDWYRDYVHAENLVPLDFVESISLDTNHDMAAQSIRDRVGFQTEIRALASTWETALTLQIEQIEESGVLVMRSGIVGANTHRPLFVEEFRGFALADKYAPLIFLNGADGKAAQMFTLAHELVHIWLGESGISNLSKTYAVTQRVESFCNSVAAKVLAPDGEVQAIWPEARTKELPWEWIGRRFKLSSLVVLRRLADLRLIRRSEFDRAYDEQEQKFAHLEARTGGGGNYYTVQKYRVSPRFARAVIESTAEGKTSFRDALNLLGMKKTDTFRRFAKEQFDFSF